MQEVLNDLNGGKIEDDRVVVELITGPCRGTFPDATQDGIRAIEELKVERAAEAKEASTKRAEHDQRQCDEQRKAERASAAMAEKRSGSAMPFFSWSNLRTRSSVAMRLSGS